MRRSPLSQSSTSALLVRPLMMRSSVPGYSAMICQSFSAMRCILKVTFVFAIAPYEQLLRRKSTPNRGKRPFKLLVRRAGGLGEMRGLHHAAAPLPAILGAILAQYDTG